MSQASNGQGPDLVRGVSLQLLAEDQPFLGHVGEQAVMLVRKSDGVRAVSATCTHYGGPLSEGLVVGDTVRCPWHHACFNLSTGAVLQPPALRALERWETEVRDGWVRVGRQLQAPRAPAPLRNPTSVLIIGGGAAGEATASALREFGYAGTVTLLSAEKTAPVDRPNLSKDYLAGHASDDWIPLRDESYWSDQNIALRTSMRVTAVDPHANRVECSDGSSLTYENLVLATGALPIRLEIPGAASPHVHTLRTWGDSRAIIDAAQKGAQHVVIVGASFIGLEAAAALRTRGLAVSVVAPESAPLARVFGTRIAAAVRAAHVEMGTVFHLGHKPARIDFRAVELDDGTRLEADLVVLGVGVQPDIALAQAAGLRVDRGIIVDAFLATSTASVYAAGDVARFPDPRDGELIRIEHWAVAQAQGRQVARNLLGFAEPYRHTPFFWSQHGEMTIAYVGHAASWDAIEEDGDPTQRDYLCRYLRQGKVVAIASIGRDLDCLREEARLQQAFAVSKGEKRGAVL